MRQRIKELVAVACGMTAEVKCNEDDDFAFMALCFLNKQIDHAQSVLRLDDSPDAVLMARTMLEGLVQLNWAAQEPDARAKRWRDFASVHDWRAVRAYAALGEPVEHAVAQAIDEGLQRIRETFFTRRAAKAAKQGIPLPADPFHGNWTGRGVDRLFEEIGDARYPIYKSFSDWLHWSIGGITRSLTSSPDGVNYVPRDVGWNTVALALTFDCLWETAQLVNNHLKLELGAQLQRVRAEWFQEAQAALADGADVEPEDDAAPTDDTR